MIQFPAVFKLSGQDELLYISDQTSFDKHYQLQQAYLLPDDLLIDSKGMAYSLNQLCLDTPEQQSIKEFALQELIALVQAHFFAESQTCVVKIQAPDHQALFNLLRDSG